MAKPFELPLPHLDARRFGARRISMLTDDALAAATGVRVAFTARGGGVSEGAYSALNLGSHVGDDPAAVACNRALLLEALDAAGAPLIVPNQVHGDAVVSVEAADADSVDRARRLVAEGADAVMVAAAEVAALLCFADCASVIVVSPTGRFCVAHAGWRGAVAGIAGKAARLMALGDADELGVDAAAAYNAYLGPHIRSECFETGSEVRERFERAFGASCIPDERHVSLAEALRVDLVRAGLSPERIFDAGACTACRSDEYFSYRASGGVCGRHGAFAMRRKG